MTYESPPKTRLRPRNWIFIQRRIFAEKAYPAKNKTKPNARLIMRYAAMSMNCPFRAILKFSPMKVEKVVNPPHRPVVSNSRTSVERLKRADKV